MSSVKSLRVIRSRSLTTTLTNNTNRLRLENIYRRRPYGLATLLAGHDMDGTPQLWQTDPSGNYASWKATCTGRNSKAVRELLEEEYEPDIDEENAVRMACRVLLETAERGAKGIEITVLRHGKEMEKLTQKAVDDLCEDIKKEDAEEDSKEDA